MRLTRGTCFTLIAILYMLAGFHSAAGQSLEEIWISFGSGSIDSYALSGDRFGRPSGPTPLASFIYGGDTLSTSDLDFKQRGSEMYYRLEDRIEILYTPQPGYSPGWKGSLEFRNRSNDTLTLKNVVPFGASPDRVHITGEAIYEILRTYQFRQGYLPENVIAPDSARDLGFSEVRLQNSGAICALSRRSLQEEGESPVRRKRFETVLPPGETITYDFWADYFEGPWQEGLRTIFQDRMLYDKQ